MTSAHATRRWITRDLLDVSGASLPQTFQMASGSTIEITFADGRVGRMTITGEPEPEVYRGRWTCAGSKYDDREFDLSWETRSEISVTRHPILVPLRMRFVPR